MDAVAAVGCTTMYLFFYVVCCVVGKYLESFYRTDTLMFEIYAGGQKIRCTHGETV
jgi:hypothetical protein